MYTQSFYNNSIKKFYNINTLLTLTQSKIIQIAI